MKFSHISQMRARNGQAGLCIQKEIVQHFMFLDLKKQTSDSDMIAGMARRDPEAFSVFYNCYAPRAFALLYRLLGDRTEAEDVLQEAFWQVWRQASAYDPSRGSPVAWLMQIARSRGIDRLRQVRSQAGRDGGPIEAWPERLSDGNATETEIIAREAQGVVHRTLAELPSDQREAITLAYFDGYTHTEIAERLQMPLGTIKTRIRLGMRKLQEAFTELH